MRAEWARSIAQRIRGSAVTWRSRACPTCGRVMGTDGYMSPEQVRGEDVDQRSDIFSLGTVIYECLAGKAPFKRDTAVETMNAILTADPPEIDATAREVSPALLKVVSRCLEK